MYLYHATKEVFTHFILDSGYRGSGGADFGYGIYFFTDDSIAEHLVNGKFMFDYQRDNTKSVIYIDNSAGVFENVYTNYLEKAKGLNRYITKRVLAHYQKNQTTKLSKWDLWNFMTLYSDIWREASPKEMGKIALFFADKNIRFAKKEVPFNRRILRVKLADDAKIWQSGKTLTENGYTYDFNVVWNLVEKEIETRPQELYSVFRAFLGADPDKCWHNQQLILKAIKRWQAKKLKKAHLMRIAKRLFQSSLAHTTAKEWIHRLPFTATTKKQLAPLFPYDGTYIRNSRSYEKDIYVICNPAKLTIESYKPYGSAEWIPVQPILSVEQRLQKFRTGGLEL